MSESKIGIDWDSILEELETAEWEPIDRHTEERQVYLGGVSGLSPSGKYYTPWASSNVEACKQCAEASDGPCDETSPCYGRKEWTDPLDSDNAEHHCEVCRDIAWQNQLDEEAGEHGLFVTSGEGDPCDIFVGQTRDTEEEG
jgi:hypothetical protein